MMTMMAMMHMYVFQRWLKQAISESAAPSLPESSNSSSYDADPVPKTPMSPVYGVLCLLVSQSLALKRSSWTCSTADSIKGKYLGVLIAPA